MNEREIALVRGSWTGLSPQAHKFPDLLYEELFGAEPQLRILFEGAMDEQHRKLVQAITHAIGQLEQMDVLLGQLRDLGAHHVRYGVRPHHFAAMEAAWMAALERMLGDAFTDDVRGAWTAFYTLLKDGMLEAGSVASSSPVKSR